MSSKYVRRRLITTFVIAGLLIASCAGGLDRDDRAVSITEVELPVRPIGLSFLSWGSIAWLPSGWIVADRDPDLPLPHGAPDLVAFRPDGSEFGRLPIGPRADCWRDETWRPTELPDGRLGFVRECYPKRLEGVDFAYHEIELAAFDPATGDVDMLADLGDVWLGHIRLILYEFAWDVTQARGVAYFGNRICDALVGVDGSGVHPLEAQLDHGTDRVRADAMFHAECEDTARVRHAALSADGRLAFGVSPSSVGRDGMARLDEPFELYFSDIDLAGPVRTPMRLEDVGPILWSPDSRWLLFAASIRGRTAQTWLYDTERSRVIGISSDRLSAAWSPDRRSIMAIRDIAGTEKVLDSEIVVVDVSSVID
ncbi:MAG TPA: hypothetical protein VGQ58_01330 [Candidatus Limnocylindrales bacterium]|jgi:hypothetical protein|nr:hypothetical protein [Candidatus Limnocylindrales bacterium]